MLLFTMPTLKWKLLRACVLIISVFSLSYAKDATNELKYHEPKPEVKSKKIKAIDDLFLHNRAQEISTFLKSDLAQTELGLNNLQDVFDRLHYKEDEPNYEDKVKAISHRLQQKLEQYYQSLQTNQRMVEGLYELHFKSPISNVQDCCTLPQKSFRYNRLYDWPISQDYTCEVLPPKPKLDSFIPGRNLTDAFQQLLASQPGLKWQHFISRNQIHTIFPSHNFGKLDTKSCQMKFKSTYRSIYLSTVYPQRKNIVVMIDCGKMMETDKMLLAKEAALYVLDSLSSHDRVNVICVSDGVQLASSSSCVQNQLCPLTHDLKHMLTNFVFYKVKSNTAITNHTAGFEKAFQLIRNTLLSDNGLCTDEKALIVYFSRGLKTRGIGVYEIINKLNSNLCNQVVISSYALKTRPNEFHWNEDTFMLDLSTQDFSRHYVYSLYPGNCTRGVSLTLTSVDQIPLYLSNFTSVLPYRPSGSPKLGVPVQDFTGRGLVVPFFKTCFAGGKQTGKPDEVIGVVGLDIHVSDLTEDVTYFNSSTNDVYAFLLTPEGYTLMHPSMKRPLYQNDTVYTDITLLENLPAFPEVRLHMLLKEKGSETIQQDDSNSYSKQVYRYTWQHVRLSQQNETLYIVAIRSARHVRNVKISNSSNLKTLHGEDVTYHRIDIVPPSQPRSVCRMGKHLATASLASLFLSPAAYVRPFNYLTQEETKSDIAELLAFLHDNTDWISLAKFQPSVRREVQAVESVVSVWLEQAKTSLHKDFIIRRYVATESGALLVFPGIRMNRKYDPHHTVWYRQAVANSGHVTVTAPYLDEGGQGYIITLSVAVLNRKASNSASNSRDKPIAVLGMDLTLGYAYRVLLQKLGGLCEQPQMRCFLMDHQGYLLAHPDLVDARESSPLEGMHITHKEHVVANDILNHREFVVKKVCNSYVDRTIQRFFTFDVNHEGTITNFGHGEHCSKYQLTVVPETNIFVGIVNQTCDVTREFAFCPCSMVDRLCLLCNRIEQTECECPCECPLNIDVCLSGNYSALLPLDPTCPSYPEASGLLPELTDASSLPPCFEYHCEHRARRIDCIGVVTCEWCALDSDGVTVLKKPFCGHQEQCFGGIVGARSPYTHRAAAGPSPLPTMVTVSSTPAGPITGGIIACILVVAMAIYCLRQRYLNRNQRHCYPEQFGDTPLANDLLEEVGRDNNGSGYNNVVLATFDTPSVSPYAVNPQYQQPPANHNMNNSESDLGYSTMTPHEDSELSSSCIEPQAVHNNDPNRAHPRNPSSQCIPPKLLPPPSTSRRLRNPSSNTADLLSIASAIQEVEPCDSSCVSVCTAEPTKTEPFSEVPPQTVLPDNVHTRGGKAKAVEGPVRIVVPIQVHASQ